jgi:hypothetical protein
VRRWPRAQRLIFLLLAGIASWAAVIVIAWLVWRRLSP